MKIFIGSLIATALFSGSTASLAAESASEIVSTNLGRGVYMLAGKGGNVGLSVGQDGTLMIDDQYAAAPESLLGAVRAISGDVPRLVVNTHWHVDHAGGNESLNSKGALILAHENVRKRMSVEQVMKALNKTVPAAPESARPALTFINAMQLRWNNDDVTLLHVPGAHTDGDTIVIFKEADVIQTGDIFFNGWYPFIDVQAGGSLAGVIAGVDQILRLAGEKTKIIPGHGPLASKADLQRFQEMLVTVRGRLEKLKAAGKSNQEIIAAKPTADYDEAWGKGFLKPEQWLNVLLQ